MGSPGSQGPESDEEDVFIDPSEVIDEIEIPEGGGDDDDMEDEMTEGQEGEEDDEGEVGMEGPIEDDSVQNFSGHHDSVFCVAINPANPAICVTGGGDDRALIWNVQTGQSLFELGGHADSVACVGFSHDGVYVATGSLEGTVRIFNVSTGSLVAALEGPSEVPWLQWHARGHVLAAGSSDGTVWMWNVTPRSATCLHVFTGHSQPTTSAAYTPDGKLLVTGSDDSSVRVWSPKDGTCCHTITGLQFHTGRVLCVATHGEQPILISGSEDQTAAVSNWNTGKPVGLLRGHQDSIESVGFCSGQPLAASGSLDSTLRIWDLNTLSLRSTCQHEGGVVKCLWHPTQPYLYSACLDGAVRVWDGRTAAAVRVFRGHRLPILDLAISPDGETIITASDDHRALVFSLT